ncbi:MAG: hypothetical protein ABIV36_20345 [Sphingobium limneticum]
MQRLEEELGLREGIVPAALENSALVTPTYQIAHDAFLLTLPNGLRFHYRRGSGTVYARPAEVSDAEVTLFFEGSVYGAIAWINGLVPLHASAVVHAGRVHAFTGASGAGKSTLVAALAERGFVAFSDDVVVLDPSDPAQIVAIPGPKRLKLWSDALTLTSQQSSNRVRPGLDKFYVGESLFAARTPLPIERLYFLESAGNHPAEIVRICGTQRFKQLQSAYYRPHFCAALAEQGAYFRTITQLAHGIAMARFHRPRDIVRFAEVADLIAADLGAGRD